MNSNKVKVMVIDDEIGTRESIRLILKDHYDVVTAEHPLTALENLSVQPVDVAIVDIRLPQMSGIEVLKRIKSISPNTEVLMVTAYASFATAQEALKHGALDYLLKPFSRKDVTSAVEKALIQRTRKLSGEEATQQVKLLMKQLRDLSEENRQLSVLSERKFSELNRKAVELSIVGAISKAMLRNLDLYELLKSVIDAVHNGLGYDHTAFFLLDEQKQEFKGVWKNEPSGNIREATDLQLPLSAVPSTLEVSQDESGAPQLSCPIRVDDKLVGMLRLNNGLSRKPIDDVEVNLIGMLAEYITIAIKNAKLYQALQERTAELTSANEHLQREIAERIRAEEALQESKRRLEAALAQLKQTQERSLQQERLRTIGQMASGIAHDFNNSLSPILGFSELLLERPQVWQDPGKVKNYLQMINTAAKDAAVVVRRLSDFYRRQDKTESFSLVDLNRLVKEVISLTQPKWKNEAQAKGITIHIEEDLAHEIPSIAGIEADLHKMLTNLLFNAVDAMSDSGTITLRTRLDGEQVILAVIDTGKGMTEEVRQRCLEPFFTTKGADGVGLGLAIVLNIIDQHEGQLEIESQLGQGTTVRVYFPVQTQKIHKKEAVKEGLKPISPRHVLLVDDEPLVRQMLVHYLTINGHTVETAANGREGLEKFRAGQFDLVITDRAMPEMNGDQLAAAIKQLAPNRPIIMLTGFGDLMETTGERVAGVDVTVSKPVALDTFQNALAQVLGKWGVGG